MNAWSTSTMFSPVLVTPPVPLVLWSELNSHLRLDDNADERDYVMALADAATAHFDGWAGILGRAIVTQTWRQDFGCFEDCMRLPIGNVQSVTSVKHYDANNVQQTFGSTNYALFHDMRGPYVELLSSASWPSVYDRADPVSITFVAGYGEPYQVPYPIKAAILLMVSNWYENREAVVVGETVAEMPLGVDRLISLYRSIAV